MYWCCPARALQNPAHPCAFGQDWFSAYQGKAPGTARKESMLQHCGKSTRTREDMLFLGQSCRARAINFAVALKLSALCTFPQSCFLAKVVALGPLTSSLLSNCLPCALSRRAKGAGNTTPHKKPAHAQSTAHRSVLRHPRQGEFLILLPHVAHGADSAVSFCFASDRTVGTLSSVALTMQASGSILIVSLLALSDVCFVLSFTRTLLLSLSLRCVLRWKWTSGGSLHCSRRKFSYPFMAKMCARPKTLIL